MTVCVRGTDDAFGNDGESQRATPLRDSPLFFLVGRILLGDSSYIGGFQSNDSFSSPNDMLCQQARQVTRFSMGTGR